MFRDAFDLGLEGNADADNGQTAMPQCLGIPFIDNLL
jgi:hypothetical protein